MSDIILCIKNVILCKPGNPQDLADKIMELKNNDELRNQIAENGYQLFEDKLSPKELVKDLI